MVRKRAFLGVSLLFCAALAGSEATRPGFPENEELSFVIRWGIVTGGRATLAVHGIELFQGKPAYHLTSDARSTGVVETFYPVRDHSDAWVDTATVVTFRYQKLVREGGYRIQEGADFDGGGGHFYQQSFRFDKQRSETR